MNTKKNFILIVISVCLLLPALWAEETIDDGNSSQRQSSGSDSDEKSNDETDQIHGEQDTQDTKEKNDEADAEAQKKRQEELEKLKDAEERQKELQRKLDELEEKERELKRREEELQKKNNELQQQAEKKQQSNQQSPSKETHRPENPPDSLLGYSLYLVKNSNVFVDLPLNFHLPFADFLKASPSLGFGTEWRLHSYASLKVAVLTGLYQAQSSVLGANPNDLELLDDTRFGIRYFQISWQGYYPIENYFEANLGLGYTFNSLEVGNYSFGNSGGFEINLGAFRSIIWGLEAGLVFSFNFWSIADVQVLDSSLTSGVSEFVMNQSANASDFKVQLLLRYKIF